MSGRNAATYRLLGGAGTPGLQVEDTTFMEYYKQVEAALAENCSTPRAHDKRATMNFLQPEQ
jgi:hypothetical protein